MPTPESLAQAREVCFRVTSKGQHADASGYDRNDYCYVCKAIAAALDAAKQEVWEEAAQIADGFRYCKEGETLAERYWQLARREAKR